MGKTPDPSHLLIVFAKNTTTGNVKSRLAESVGQEQAREVYRRLREGIKESVSSLHCDIEAHYYPEIEQEDLWSVPPVVKRQQHGTDIGERMKNAIQSGLDAGYAKVCLIGTDIPDLTDGVVRDAFTALNNCAVVFGPAEDGGYYLIGMSQMVSSLFVGIPWSTGSVLEKSINKLAELKIKYETVQRLLDVDTVEDLRKAGLRPMPREK